MSILLSSSIVFLVFGEVEMVIFVFFELPLSLCFDSCAGLNFVCIRDLSNDAHFNSS